MHGCSLKHCENLLLPPPADFFPAESSKVFGLRRLWAITPSGTRGWCRLDACCSFPAAA